MVVSTQSASTTIGKAENGPSTVAARMPVKKAIRRGFDCLPAKTQRLLEQVHRIFADRRSHWKSVEPAGAAGLIEVTDGDVGFHFFFESVLILD